MRNKILIAEDHDDIRTIIRDRLMAEGYEVVTAVDGEDALDKIRQEDPDVILLDLMMPKVDGYQVLEEIRAHPVSGKWQPVIIISAKQEFQDIKKGFALKADHYITKPWRMEDILEGIRKLLILKEYRKNQPELDSASE